MKISVIVPVYNAERFIRGCMDSILCQTRPADEIVVVNDGSSDGTRAMLKDYEADARVIDQENLGRSAARNRALDEASGDYVAFLDADDTFTPGHLEALAGAGETTGAEIVHDCCRMPFLTEGENEALLRRHARDTACDHLYRFHLVTPTAMVRREWVRAQGVRFEEGMAFGEDALFFMSLIAVGARVAFVPSFGAVIGIHDRNTTRDYDEAYRRGYAAYEKLDAFLSGRGVKITGPVRRCIEKGKAHTRILRHLMGLYKTRDGAHRRALRPYVRRPAVAAVDRLRCMAAQVWPWFPLARAPGVLRAMFGYSVMRMARTREEGPS